MQTRGALRSSPLPERAAGAELVLAGAAPRMRRRGGRGRARDGVESGAECREREGKAQRGREREARRGPRPRPSPPRGRLSAGGYRGGTVPCCRARARPRAPGTGVPTPSSLGPPSPLPSSVAVAGRAPRAPSLLSSLPAEAVASRRRPAGPLARGRLCRVCSLFRFSSPGWGSLRSPGVRPLSLSLSRTLSLPLSPSRREEEKRGARGGGRDARGRRVRPVVRARRRTGQALGLRPQIRRGDPLNLSILVSGGKETNEDSLSNGERRGKSPAPNPRPAVGRGTCGVQKPPSPAALSGDPSPCDRGRSPRTV